MASGIDLKEFRQFTRDLKAFKPDKQVKKALTVAGDLIVDDARLLVGPYSKSVPPAIKKKLRKTTITVEAGGPDVPMAGLLERGNRGGRSREKFRHPVHGHMDTWVEQPMHPYLDRAVKKNERAIERYEGEIVAAAFREVGWRGD